MSAACEGVERGGGALWPNLKLLKWPPSFPVIGQEAEAMAEGSDGRRVETTGVKRGTLVWGMEGLIERVHSNFYL